MKHFENFSRFRSEIDKKNIRLLLISVCGINLKCLDRIRLLNGWAEYPAKFSIKSDDFVHLKSQVSFFYSIELNKIYNNVSYKKNIKSYSGLRHSMRLPVRGQRTHTNSKTARNNIKKEI